MSEGKIRLAKDEVDDALAELSKRYEKVRFAINALDSVENGVEGTPTEDIVSNCIEMLEREARFIDKQRHQLVHHYYDYNDTEKVRDNNKE